MSTRYEKIYRLLVCEIEGYVFISPDDSGPFMVDFGKIEMIRGYNRLPSRHFVVSGIGRYDDLPEDRYPL